MTLEGIARIVLARSPLRSILRSGHSLGGWRKGWDSNPRWTCAHASFQDWCLKPLGHPSGSALHGAKATPFASFAAAVAFASGKPQNFNAVFTTRESGRLASRSSGCILTNAGLGVGPVAVSGEVARRRRAVTGRMGWHGDTREALRLSRRPAQAGAAGAPGPLLRQCL